MAERQTERQDSAPAYIPSHVSADTFALATGGYDVVQDDWVSATALRPLLQEDPVLAWLRWHGEKHGFKKDAEPYAFLTFIGKKGSEFEAVWVKNLVGSAESRAMEHDYDVREAKGLLHTLALMEAGAEVITKAALWWAPDGLYGTADVLCKASWLYKTFPHLRPADAAAEPDHYVIIDCKFTTCLHETAKRKDYLLNATQVRIYSYIVGKLTGYTPRKAYLATRDRPMQLVEVEIPQSDQGCLDPEVARLRDEYLAIKNEGADWLPWTHPRTAPNFGNAKDDPWHGAKKVIASKYIPGGPLEWLPGIGRAAAAALRNMGYSNLSDVLAASPDIDWMSIRGVGAERSKRLRAVLDANRMGQHTPPVLKDPAPPRAAIELFVDFEFLSNVNVDFGREWPVMAGCEMVFMIGVGWEEGGRFRYKQFVAAREDHDSERSLFVRFLHFLHSKGVFDPDRSAACIYHWSAAEVAQARKAARRHGLSRLNDLPWCDLQKPFKDGPIGIPGSWGFGLKEVAQALGTVAPDFAVKWPDDLGDGLSAMVMGWGAYERNLPSPEASPEMQTLSKYLRTDVEALWSVLRWLRYAESAGRERSSTWYPLESGGPRLAQKFNAARLASRPPAGWYERALSGCDLKQPITPA